MLKLTNNAVKHFKKMLGKKMGGIRISATSGGWGPSLAMDIADAPIKGDITLEQGGVKIFLEHLAHGLLFEATLDHSEKNGITLKGMARYSCCG